MQCNGISHHSVHYFAVLCGVLLGGVLRVLTLLHDEGLAHTITEIALFDEAPPPHPSPLYPVFSTRHHHPIPPPFAFHQPTGGFQSVFVADRDLHGRLHYPPKGRFFQEHFLYRNIRCRGHNRASIYNRSGERAKGWMFTTQILKLTHATINCSHCF